MRVTGTVVHRPGRHELSIAVTHDLGPTADVKLTWGGRGDTRSKVVVVGSKGVLTVPLFFDDPDVEQQLFVTHPHTGEVLARGATAMAWDASVAAVVRDWVETAHGERPALAMPPVTALDVHLVMEEVRAQTGGTARGAAEK